VESRVGFRVLLRASGAVRPALSAADLSVSYARSWNPLRSGTIHLSYTATNTGNVRVATGPRVEVSSLLSRSRSLTGAELLPGGTHTATATVVGVWSLGRLRTTVTLTPAVLGGAPGVAGPPTSVTVTTWALPWPQLLLVAALVALALVARYRRRRFRRLLAEAREGHQVRLPSSHGS